MHPKQLVKLSNTIGVVSIILLFFWVFVFSTINVFGLKVFRENLTETFYLSILGILALMAGALIVNIMFNLTRIAEKHNLDAPVVKSGKGLGLFFLISLPILAALLFGGDYLTTKKREGLLVDSAESIVQLNQSSSDHFSSYRFEKDWIIETNEALRIMSRTDKDFPNVVILVQDSIDHEPTILGFTQYRAGNLRDTIPPKKSDYIRQTTLEEREYLKTVFDEGNTDHRYSSHKGNYELFYPYFVEDNKIVIYFSKHQRYGKIGS